MTERLADYKWSSYLTYAYGKKAEEWLATELILSQFKGNKKAKYKMYRQKVQQYSNEEKNTWEDFSHGMFFGTRKFIDEMRLKYLPKELHKEKPQQKDVKKSQGMYKQLEKLADILDIDLKNVQNSRRLVGEDKTKRDLMIYLFWMVGIYRNEEIGDAFGISYSSVSKSVTGIRQLIIKDKKVKAEFKVLYSQFKM